MKNLNLPALGQITLEDITLFMSWLDKCPSGETSIDFIKRNPPIRGSKVNPIIKVLDQFALINSKQNRIVISGPGKDFARSSSTVRKAVIRTLFMKVEQVQRILELLKASATGRLHKRVVNDSFSLGSPNQIADSEILGFIAWAQSCELFYYDKTYEEIFCINPEVPKEPKVSSKPSSSLPPPMRLVS
jgi:hypothetical protein